MRKWRLLLATISFCASLSLFWIWWGAFNSLARIQVGPRLSELLTAVTTGSAVGLFGAAAVVLAALALTALFGRWYCAVICPFGILQDALIGLTRLLRGRRFAFRSHRSLRWWRFGILLAVAGMLAAGWVAPFMRLEPFTNFGVVANGAGRPLYVWLNNLLRPGELLVLRPEWGWMLGGALLLLLVLGALCVWRGRIFCNLLCPVGALLSLPAGRSWFRVRLDPEKCVKCNQCVRSCPAECLDPAAGTVDAERCVVCGNCLSRCKFGALSYRRSRPGSAPEPALPSAPGRREWLGLGLAVAGGAVLGTALTPRRRLEELAAGASPELPILPPGAGSQARFAQRCTGCQICVANCLGNVLRPSSRRLGQVELRFERGMCEFNCRRCTEVCPSGALLPLTRAEKRRTRLGLAEYRLPLCIPSVYGTECGACAEHCPTGALRMVPGPNGAQIPALTEELCIGCGNCEYACPVRPERAIVVRGVRTQVLTTDPAEYFRKPASPAPSASDEWAF